MLINHLTDNGFQSEAVVLSPFLSRKLRLKSTPPMGKEPKSHRHAGPQCDYKTKNVSDLRKHVRAVHEKRRDHACSQCDAAFGQAGNLRKHVRTVHKQRKQQPGNTAPGIWSHALLDLVQPGNGNGNTVTLATASF